MLDGKKFKGLVDRGADASIIKSNEWPSNWPTISCASSLIGVGGMQRPRQSPHLWLVLGPDGKICLDCPIHCLYTMHIMGKRCSETIFTEAIDQPFQNQVLDT